MNNHPRYIWLEEDDITNSDYPDSMLMWTTTPSRSDAIKYRQIAMHKVKSDPDDMKFIFLEAGGCDHPLCCYERGWCQDVVFDDCEYCTRKTTAYERVDNAL